MSMLQLIMLGGGGEASYVVSESTNALDEGSTVAITLTTANVPGQTYYWEFVTISGTISGSDFVGGNSSGNFSTTIGTGSFNLTLANDYSSEGNESFQVRIRKDSNSGDIVATSNTITITDTSTTTYSVTPSSANVDEGNSINFVVNTNGIANSTTLYYTLTNLDAQDLSSGSLTGSFTTSGATGTYNTGGSATVSFGISNDYHTEGADSFAFQLRTGSTSGTVVATSSNVTINDTSTGTYSVTPTTTSMTDSGGSTTFNIDTNPNRNNATLYYTLEAVQGTINNSDFSSGTVTGSFTTNSSGNGSVSFTTQNDGVSGEQIFTFNVRLGSITGRIVATSSNVTITESTAQLSYQLYGGGGGGGGGVSSNTCGGGGGAGEYLSGNVTVTIGSPFQVTCGGGGPAGNGFDPGTGGNDSIINTVTADGGGAGRGYNSTPAAGSRDGGSGGGGNGGNGGPNDGGSSQPGGNPGFAGSSTPGAPYSTDYGFGGGGGGASTGGPTTTKNKNGGNGISSPLFGTTVCGGGGGGANDNSAGGNGGPGGGGDGGGSGNVTANGDAPGGQATAGSGGGGGGASVRGTGPVYSNGGGGADGRVAISKPSSINWGTFTALTYISPSPNIRVITAGNGNAEVTN